MSAITQHKSTPAELTRGAGKHRRWVWGVTAACMALSVAVMLIPGQSTPRAVASTAATENTDNADGPLARGSILSPSQMSLSAEPSIGPAPIAGSKAPVALPSFSDASASFNGRKLKAARTIEMLVTAYSPDERSCGKSADGITASGMSVWTNGMKLVAADTHVLPMKSIISIPGYNQGKPVPVLDRGGAIKGNRLDVLFPTHEAARKWGKKTLSVVVWEYAE
jgi:3D (Asp-Asp-Asp) domain-containing protein